MGKSIHIIYVPGFGGKYDWLRSLILRCWRFRNITAEMVPMDWGNGTFTQKMDDINMAIDRASGKKVVLIGESAGGSMVVHALAHRPSDLHGVMTLCGKNILPETVDKHYIEYSPAFGVSMKNLNDSISNIHPHDRKRFVSLHPIYDPTVPVKETLLPGCRQKRVWLIGHVPVIFITITLLSRMLVNTARDS